ncbi:AraC family transcriptional regulator [Pedobacter foliorum]|uniref:helix-turn-helix domain-containing protein n=1 Tax=Pedobacter foliorum TaxID=2739058 RepID=UPI0015671C34|nr:AraC family transcriptional regulator [Pedobacter foliorum]NRF38349.1 helix-turn-helix transcriptional regulator [Pedobacter foliorum]
MYSKRYYPNTALSEYISAYILSDYGVDGFADDTTCIYPSGSAILCFSLNGVFSFKATGSDSIIKLTKFNFIPQFKTPRFYDVITCPTKVLHVVFKPYGAYRLLGIPQNLAFYEHGTSLFDMLTNKIGSLLNHIEDAAYNSNLVIHLVNRWLESQFLSHQKLDVSSVSYACRLIEANEGTLAIEQLAQSMRLSKRALEYHFQEQIGLSPKLYSRITRFNALFNTVKNDRSSDWQELLFKYNYFDQAHLIKEFKCFSGNSPSRLSQVNPILTVDF